MTQQVMMISLALLAGWHIGSALRRSSRAPSKQACVVTSALGANSCPANSEPITTWEDCIRVTGILARKGETRRMLNNGTHYPKGCLQNPAPGGFHPEIVFNMHDTGGNIAPSWLTTVCRVPGVPCPPPKPAPVYQRQSRSCISGHDLQEQRYEAKSVSECKTLCDQTPGCAAFEYAVEDSSTHKAGDCQPKDTIKTEMWCSSGVEVHIKGVENLLLVHSTKKAPQRSWWISIGNNRTFCSGGNFQENSTTVESCILQPGRWYYLHCLDGSGEGWDGSFVEFRGKRYCDTFRGGREDKVIFRTLGLEEAPLLAKGARESNECPANSTPIESAEACARAATSLGFEWDGVTTSAYRPKGCFEFARNLRFNQHPIGEGSSWGEVWCSTANKEFAKSDANANDCPAGTHPIQSSAACAQAARSLEESWALTVSSDKSPKGCYSVTSSGMVFFNEHPKGAASKGTKILCSREAR